LWFAPLGAEWTASFQGGPVHATDRPDRIARARGRGPGVARAGAGPGGTGCTGRARRLTPAPRREIESVRPIGPARSPTVTSGAGDVAHLPDLTALDVRARLASAAWGRQARTHAGGS